MTEVPLQENPNALDRMLSRNLIKKKLQDFELYEPNVKFHEQL